MGHNEHPEFALCGVLNEVYPPGQLEQLLEPLWEKVPGEQAEQAEAPLLEYSPLVQIEHAEARLARTNENDPLAQLVQEVEAPIE